VAGAGSAGFVSVGLGADEEASVGAVAVGVAVSVFSFFFPPLRSFLKAPFILSIASSAGCLKMVSRTLLVE
jgi:hypothetical protein